MQHAEEVRDVGGVQAGGRFVEDVQGAPRRTARQFGRQFQALRLAAGKRRRRLPKAHVAQPDVGKHLQLVAQRRDAAEERQCLGDRHIEDVGDVLPLEEDLKRLAVVALPVARLARHVHVRQEVHLDADHPLALARLAPATLDIEGEPPRAVPTHARLRDLGVRLANRCEDPRKGRRITARRPTNWCLIDVDHLVKHLGAFDGVVRPGPGVGTMDDLGEPTVKNVGHKA
jgi:hypothetical protein